LSIAPDLAATTDSPLILSGPTSVSWQHTPSEPPRAAVLFAFHSQTSSSGVSSASYGGVPMTPLGDYDNGTTPFPGVAMFFLDDVPAGEQTVVFAKASGTFARGRLITILADGEVVVADSDGGSGNNLQPAVPAMVAPDVCLGLAGNLHVQADPATGRSHTLLWAIDQGPSQIETQYGTVEGDDVVFEWAYPTTAVNARAGLLLLDPNPPPPPTEWTIDFETGDLSQAAYVQAIPGRITVVTDPALEGVYSGRFEVQGGDVEPDTGSQRAELKTLLEFQDGDRRYFRVCFRVDQWDFDHWGMIWQLHDDSDGSPPLALMIEEGTGQLVLQHGNGSVEFWRGQPVVIGQTVEVVIGVTMSSAGVLEVWRDRVKQTLADGSKRLTDIDTIGTAPAYDKVGIYRSIESTDPAVVYHDGYKVRRSFAGVIPPIPAARVMSEPVDDRIYVEAESASGRRTRWADDDPDASGIPVGIEVHDTSPGGFADSNWGFVRDPRRDWPDLDLIDKVKVYGRTAPLGRSLFEGQQEQFPSEIGESFSIGNQAIGRQRLLAAKPYRELIADRDPAGWGAMSLPRRGVVNANGWVIDSDYQASTEGGGIRFDGSAEKAIPALSVAEMHYALPAGVRAAKVGYKGTEANTSSVQEPLLFGSDTDAFSAVTTDPLTLDDTVRTVELATARRYLSLLAISLAGHTPLSAGVAFRRTYEKVGIYGDHGLALRDVAGDLPGVYGHDAIAHVVAPSGLKYTTGPNGTIRDNPSFVIPQLAWLGSGHKRWGAIEEINAWFLWRPEVWENDTFWWQPWDADALTWKARIQGGAHWSPAGRQASTLFNGVVVSYTDHAGIERTAGPIGSGCDDESELLQNTDPSNPLNSHGEQRWEELNVGYPLTPGPTGSAIQLGYVWMVDHSRPQRSGTLTVRPLGEGHIPQLEHPTIGAVPIWAARSGDYIDLVDFPDPEPFKVLDRKYTHESKTAVFVLDTASTALSAILARLEVKTASR